VHLTTPRKAHPALSKSMHTPTTPRPPQPQNQHRHARAHYAAAQVSALTGNWAAAEASYTRCAQLAAASDAPSGDYRAFLGQARFCVGTAQARQGRSADALASYRAAEAAGFSQPHALAQARGAALMALGRLGEARRVVEAALRGGGGVDAAAAADGAEQAAGGDGAAAAGGVGAGGQGVVAAGFVDMSPVLLDLMRRIDEQLMMQKQEPTKGEQRL